jgi:hypothetical protein
MLIRNIAIFGFSEAEPGGRLYQDAYKVSRLLAEAGYTIVNGGGPGVMRASTEGAKAGGGKTIGVCFSPVGMTNFEGRDPNNLVDQELVVPNYVERTLKLLELGDCYIIFAGGTGTISELGMAWGLARLYFGHHKPLILYGSLWYPILEAIAANLPLRQQELEVYRIIVDSKQVLSTIREFEAKM